MSGVAAGITAARGGCKVLIVEKNSYLGGTATGGLVTPMMKNALKNGKDLNYNLNSKLYGEILDRLALTGDAATFKDGNAGWFNPEVMKCVLDDFCEEENIDVLFDTTVVAVLKEENAITSIQIFNRSGLNNMTAKYFVDATGDADLSALAGVPYESGENGVNQAMSLRFTMTNINLEKFAWWLDEIDSNSDVTSIYRPANGETLIHTAYTWDNKDWKLKPYFEKGIAEDIITKEDSAYFQVFSIPGQRGSLAFNCPRIYADKSLNLLALNPLDTRDISLAYKIGRQQIRRISKFCVKYFPGFEESSVGQIAPMLGIRDSRRIKGKYTLTEQDIAAGRKFENPVARSNYPVDIHSGEKNKSELTFLNEDDYYEIPLEALMPVGVDNLLVVGRCISATFKAQASLRIIPNCISMGEAAGKYLSKQIQKEDNNDG